MATGQNSHVIKKYAGDGGKFVDSDHLSAAFDRGGPDYLGGQVTQIFSAMDRFKDKPLLAMTQAAGNIKFINNNTYRWRLRGSDTKHLTVLENLESSNTAPGVGHTTFTVKLDEGWCAEPDVLMGEDADYPLEIVGSPEAEGNGYVYTLRLQDSNPGSFLPTDLLSAGKKFKKVWTTTTDEANDLRGSMQWGGSFMLESRISYFGQEVTITDKAQRYDNDPKYSLQSGLYGVPVVIGGKVVEKFIPAAEALMLEEKDKSIEAQLTFGKRSNSDSITKYRKGTGPGLREQMKDGHIEYFSSTPDVDDFEEYLMDIFFARKGEKDRKVTIMTGTMGSKMLHDMIVAKLGANSFVDSQWFTREAPDRMPYHLSFGAQFTHYFAGEGIEFDVVKNPMYDSTEYQMKTHPDYPSRPIDSWRFTILDFGKDMDENGDMVPNIQMLKEKDYYGYGYVPGAIGPSGVIKGGAVPNSKRMYKSFCDDSAGLLIRDASRVGEWIYEFN